MKDHHNGPTATTAAPPPKRVIFSFDPAVVLEQPSKRRNRPRVAQSPSPNAAHSRYTPPDTPTTTTSTSSDSETNMKQEWRRYGAARRKEIIATDEQQGGTRFELYKKCRIEQYFHIADRVRV